MHFPASPIGQAIEAPNYAIFPMLVPSFSEKMERVGKKEITKKTQALQIFQRIRPEVAESSSQTLLGLLVKWLTTLPATGSLKITAFFLLTELLSSVQ